MSSTNVNEFGTLLQNAVSENKQELARILLEFGFVHFVTARTSTLCPVTCSDADDYIADDHIIIMSKRLNLTHSAIQKVWKHNFI